MKHYLICAATEKELKAWPGIHAEDKFERGIPKKVPEEIEFSLGTIFTFLITGVGVPLTLNTLHQMLPSIHKINPINQMLNIGIAGAYPKSGLNIGDVLIGMEECYGDIGVEDPETKKNDWGYRPLGEFDFGRAYKQSIKINKPYFLESRVLNSRNGKNPTKSEIESGIRFAKGITVNTCTGTEKTALLREQLYQGAFETMEGAAVADVARLFKIPSAEIRSISNIAGPRDMQAINIEIALEALKQFLLEYQHIK